MTNSTETQIKWWEVLGLDPSRSFDRNILKQKYHKKARLLATDSPHYDEALKELNHAMDMALTTL